MEENFFEKDTDFKLDLTTDKEVFYFNKNKNNIRNNLIDLGGCLSILLIIYFLSKIKKIIKKYKEIKFKE